MAAHISLPLLIFRNLMRKRFRTAILILVAAAVSAAVFISSLFFAGVENSLETGAMRLGADVIVIPKQYDLQARSALLTGEPTHFTMNKKVLDEIRNVKGVKQATPQLFLKPLPFSCCYDVKVFLVAFAPESDFTVTPWLRSKLKRPLSDAEVITGGDIPALPGDTIPFFGTRFTVAGTMEPTGMVFLDRSVFMTMNAAHRMAEESRKLAREPLSLDRDAISAVLVRSEEEWPPARTAIMIEHGVKGVKAIPSGELTSAIKRQIAGVSRAVSIFGALLWLISMLMLGSVFSMIVNERNREMAILRSIGANRKHIFMLVIGEAAALTSAGCISGIVAGLFIVRIIPQAVYADISGAYLMPSAGETLRLSVTILASAISSGVAAALIPAVSASRLEPYEAVKAGE